MEVKPGVEQAEMELIPEDWKHRSFGHLYAEPSRNGIYKSSEYQGRGTRIVNMGEMFGLDFISDQDMSRVALTTKEIFTNGLQDGDLLFGRRSVVPAGAGKCSLVVSPTDPVTFESSIIRVRLDRNEVAPRFYYYFFSSPVGRSVVGTIVSGTNVKGIRATELRKLNVPLPPKAEQEAIAEALSDADVLIESLEQFLGKKRNVKQGVMQELLTGKRRLPGFSGAGQIKSEIGELPNDWQVLPIGLIAQVKTGPFGSSLHERDYVDDGTPIVTVEHLGERSIIHTNLPTVSAADRKRLDAYSLKQGDVVFSRVGSVDRNALVTAAETGWLFSGRLLRVRASSSVVDAGFLSYQFHSEPFKQRVRTVAVGQTMASLNTQILKGVLVALPPLRE
jgi:type I restriction enzyme S subunit